MLTVLLKDVHSYFERILDFFETKLVKEVPLGDSSVQVPLMPVSDLGHLVPIKCGHRGKPSRHEERMLDILIRDSGFLDKDENPSLE